MADYLKVTITVSPPDPWSDLLVQDLGDLGFESFEAIHSRLNAYIQEDMFNLNKYETLIKEYADRAQIATEIEKVKRENWNIEWESNYHPIEVAEKIFIRAAFHDKNPSFEYDILITPKMSFGTGHHATTKLMLTEMLSVDFKSKRVLDVGCGTGILSIFAKMRGASFVFGIDIDEWAVENSNENLGLNKCTDILIEKGEIDDVSEKSYNVILANINYNVIMMDLLKYSQLMLTGGELLLSGFYHTQKNDIISTAGGIGLLYKNDLALGEWCMLHLIKS
jgi:ribosomal protein L11 methyltransferase